MHSSCVALFKRQLLYFFFSYNIKGNILIEHYLMAVCGLSKQIIDVRVGATSNPTWIPLGSSEPPHSRCCHEN